ncbi:hypothetical protein MLD38_005193 [Melastoma candidum]|uniref:Uncharacterized protein n=1 Tax=Melastoma candidum TaxID=119954 RepID=A0ACB9S8H4_9MYRT|nr:hypothetical protein MLD38_005193 [Melastoma candidum]
MWGEILSSTGNGMLPGGKFVQAFQKGFFLDLHKLLIKVINRNQESRIHDNLSGKVGLIKERNNNIKRVVNLYADLSS